MSVRAGFVLIAVALAACSEASAPPAPTPGTLVLSVTRPDGNDAALLLQLTGPGLGEGLVQAVPGVQHVYARAAQNGVRVAVFGLAPSGPLLRLSVPDVKRVADYQATLVEAADAQNALRANLAGYTFRWSAEQ